MTDSLLPEHNRLARLLRLARTGDPASVYEQARDGLARAGDECARAEWADCLSDCCLKLLRYEEALGYSKQAAAIWETQRNMPRLARSLSRMAEFLSDLGAPGASATARRAIDLAERSGDDTAMMIAYMTMGIVLFLAQQADKAVAFTERALDIKRRIGDDNPLVPINCAEAIVLAAVRAAEDGDRMGLRPAIARAVSLSREALAEALAVGDGWCARLALNNIADYSMHVDDIDTAATALAQVAGLPGQPTLRCRTHHGLAQGRLQAARGELESAYEIFTACIEEVRDDTYMELKLDCLNELTRVLERMGRFEAALQTHRDYHNVYVRMASEGAQRMARLAAQEHEIEELRDAVGHAQSLASTLVRSNAELAREAERLLRTNLEDSLTGLPNRRRFEAELAGLAPGETGFACAMLDVDHFKQVNDRYSHVIGDAVLRKLGEIFTRQARQDDVLARFGGEEFALLIRAHDPVSVRQICERLRGAVEDADWAGIQAGLAIRLSVGFALGHEAGQPELVMKLADERLYAAKRAGRNQVIGPA